MRIFTATLGTETNTFSPLITGLSGFKDRMYWRPYEHPDYPTEQTAPLWIGRQRVKLSGWDVVEGSCFFAAPAGPVAKSTYEFLRDEILEQLRHALPVDAVALGMHGAMVASGYNDCEGDMLSRVREIVGEYTPVGVELDLHCHISEQMCAAADLIVCFKEYPHIDYLECGETLMDMLDDMVHKDFEPEIHVFDCQMIDMFRTMVEPIKSWLDNIKALEGKDGVRSISIAHGFPWGDVPDMGTKVLVVGERGHDYPKQLVRQIGNELQQFRGTAGADNIDLDAALEKAETGNDFPVVIADLADNVGAGAPGDSTFVLHELLNRNMTNACIGPLYDPLAVGIVSAAGEGAELKLRIGGKLDPSSGMPVDVTVKVIRVVGDASQSFAGEHEPMGAAVSVEFQGIAVVLTSVRCQALGPDLFSNLGIDPSQRKTVVVKSSQHFYAGFAPIAASIIYCATPGNVQMDLAQVPYTKIERPKWPIDNVPFADIQDLIVSKENIPL